MTDSLKWRVSSFCAEADCVAVAALPDRDVAIKDTKEGGHLLRFSQQEWRAFLAGVRAGEFDF